MPRSMRALALAPSNRLALALADARVEDGSLRPYAPSPEECLHGWFGNRVRVNGALDVRLPVAQGWVRLQLLNACNARGLLIAFRETNARGVEAREGGATLLSICSAPTAGCWPRP
jgi:FtsP/CotA-like multicopper oxidase with cupredoxin domain